MARSGGPGSFVFGDEERKEVMDVLEGRYLFRYGAADAEGYTHKVVDFEDELKKVMGAKYAVATTSGTCSLLASLAALGIGAGDEVIVPGYTFIASISTIMLAGAIPVLAEIDESLTIDVTKIESLITPKTKAILPVHMLGNPCNLDAIMEIAKKHNLYVLEDCCQAVGASYKGKRVGTYGNIGAFSLNVFKTISTGDGGAVITNDENLYERAFGYHDQGHKPNRLGVEVGNRSIIGMNMRMNELTGAVALAQTRKLDEILETLRYKKKMLKDLLSDLPHISFRKINDEGECATLLTILFDTKELAEAFCEKTGGRPIAYSGWHVYNNMEQVLEKKMPAPTNNVNDRVYTKGMLPQTDDILGRAVNISVGVVDKGLGSGYGINILSTEDEIKQVAANIRELILSL
ncbi:MAG: DegT/DnrJ/EryC1/StrS family aminotransferase [Clostridia bacterium]|nr:DegT/DnrJ/EryC1/StrS family aminotransferase [Oscillospiraceae bacterium]MBQ2696726.1 DegT/DnrJ/EryC1/StrS family aminotransferase [Clostridia bacterium]